MGVAEVGTVAIQQPRGVPDDLPVTAGQTTTAAAMGPALRERLVKAGMTFATLSTDDY